MRYIISIALASLLSLPARADVPRVVTDLPPVGSLVAQVMGDLGAPVVLLDNGADAHAFQLRPSQAADVAEAQAIIWIGPQMTPWLDRAMAGRSTKGMDLQLLAVPGTVLLNFADDHADHDHGRTDPHAWLDPANAAVWLAAISGVLSEFDPANAATYAANAATAQIDLQRLDADLQALLAPAKDRPLVVFHNAYTYFASRYGLNVVGAISDGDAASPGAAHLRDLQSRIGEGPVCLFPEANHDPKLLATLAETPGVKIGAELDPEGSAQPIGPTLYEDMMRAMAQAIADCVLR